MNKYNMIGKIILGFIGAFIIVLLLYFQKTYTVTFDTKGGTIYKAAEVRINQRVVRPPDPVMEGYIFEGWYLNDTDIIYDFDAKVNSNITITAKWKEIS